MTLAPLRRDALTAQHLALTAAVGLASLLDSAAIIAVGLGIALWGDAFAMDVWTIGALSATLTVSIALGALVGGRVADLVGRERVFASTLAVYAAGAGAVAAAPSAAWLFAGVAVMGAASGADLPAALAVLSERAPHGTVGRLVGATHVMWTTGVVLTTAAGLALSTLGLGGVRAIFAGLAVIALLTAGFRRLSPGWWRSPDAARALPVRDAPALPLRRLLASRAFAVPLLLTGGFYALYTLVASTSGNFKTYFLITVSGATQTVATAVTLATGVVGLLGSIVFAALADSARRERLFRLGLAGLLTSLAILTVTGGAGLPAVVAALVLYNVSFPFVGDAIYKVWTQESFPVETRATAQGTTIAAARALAAAFALVTPALLDEDPHLLFGLLTLFAAGAGCVGLAITRRSQR